MPHNEGLAQAGLILGRQIGRRLRQARLDLHLSRNEFAKKCEVTSKAVQYIEEGRTHFESLLILRRAADAAGVDLNSLISG